VSDADAHSRCDVTCANLPEAAERTWLCKRETRRLSAEVEDQGEAVVDRSQFVIGQVRDTIAEGAGARDRGLRRTAR
jgi:hypothetical protein